jgi:secondary thiamine-phosphate synthase enzyme
MGLDPPSPANRLSGKCLWKNDRKSLGFAVPIGRKKVRDFSFFSNRRVDCPFRLRQCMWFQRTLTLPAKPRGFHLVTSAVVAAMPELAEVGTGMLQVFLQHTSASLTINENADPDVRIDFETAMNRVVPESLPYVHTIEGPDDMPAHVKASMMGASVQIPVGGGRLLLGTWQGIYLCEHRDRGGARRVVITLMGESTR